MTLTAPISPPQVEDGPNLLDLLAAIWSGKFFIAAVMSAALVLGAISFLKTQQIYSAHALLQLEQRSAALALPSGMQDSVGRSSGNLGTAAEMAILRSRKTMTQVAQELDLQTYAYPRPLPYLGLVPVSLGLTDPSWAFLRPYQWGNEEIRLGELEVPTNWLGASLTLTILGPSVYRITLPDDTIATGTLQERLVFSDTGFSLVVDKLDGPVGREFIFGRLEIEKVVDKLKANFSVKERPSGSSILQTTFNGPDPRLAETVLDAIARSYIIQNLSHSAAEVENNQTFIAEQLPLAKQSVTEAQNVLNRYLQQQKSFDLDFKTRTLLKRTMSIEAQLNALITQEFELKQRYTVNHPEYISLLQNRSLLQAQLEEVRNATFDIPETQKEIFNLTSDLEVSKQVYTQLLSRGQELQVVSASTVGSVRIIDAAYSDGSRIAPSINQTLMCYLTVSVVLSIGIVLFRWIMRRGIRGAQEIEKIGLSVFATVNYSPDATDLRERKGVLPILALSNSSDLVVEELRSLRTSLHFGMLDAKTNTVMLTSAAPNVGKSFIAVNLAVIAAQSGRKVCIIDADLRKGYLHQFFAREKDTPGLSELLSKEKSLEDVLIQGPVEGLSVITSGLYPPNPSELLMRSDFKILLEVLNKTFDLIIVDSPPVLAVTDPVVIGRHTGITLLVTWHLKTVLEEVEAARNIFEIAGVKVTGAILNGYKTSEGSKNYGQYQSYNYRYSHNNKKTLKA